tara:strand:- start:2159 stop:2482 length:324 start_codon:yes stop_codon:yes gene_type:complete
MEHTHPDTHPSKDSSIAMATKESTLRGSESVSDLVNRPAHYVRDGGLECIDVMTTLYGQKRVREWAEITAFKYQWRQGAKAGNSSVQDKLKSIWYTRFSMGDDPRND